MSFMWFNRTLCFWELEGVCHVAAVASDANRAGGCSSAVWRISRGGIWLWSLLPVVGSIFDVVTCLGVWADLTPPPLFSCRWSSGDAPLPAPSLPEAACVSWGPAAPAVHRLLHRPLPGAAVASQRPPRDHAGGLGRPRGGEPASRLLPAHQVRRGSSALLNLQETNIKCLFLLLNSIFINLMRFYVLPLHKNTSQKNKK